MTTWRSAFIAGIRAISPILLGVVPFGLIAGITASSVGIPPLHGLAMSVVIFAGASQLAAMDLIGQNSPVTIIVLTVLVINLRLTMYSASIAPHFRRLSGRWKGLLAYLLTDQAYAVSITRFAQDVEPANKHWFYLGTALALWGTWQVTSAAGIFVGVRVPDRWSLDFAIPLTFLALLLPAIRDRASAAAALAAGLVAVLAFGLPFNLGLIVAALAGILVGLAAERRPT